MPKVTQTTMKPMAGTSPKKTPTSTRRPATQSDDGWGSSHLNVLVYGDPKTGKTRFVSTFPDPILWLICSGGNRSGELKTIDTPANRGRITPKTIHSADELAGYVEMAHAGGYATVVLDHLTGLQDLTLKEVLGLAELPAQKKWGLATQQQYGESTLQCKEFCRGLFNAPCNTVVIAQQKTLTEAGDIDPEIAQACVGPAVTKSLGLFVNPAVDVMVQTYKATKTKTVTTELGGTPITIEERVKGVEFRLRTGAHDTYLTGFRCPIENYLPDYLVNATYADLMAIIAGNWPRPGETE